MHFKLGDGRVTAAIDVERELISGKDTAFVSLAFCCPNDQFSRKKGRLISEGRLGAGKIFCEVPLVPGERVKSQVMAHLRQNILQNEMAPTAWGRNAAPPAVQ